MEEEYINRGNLYFSRDKGNKVWWVSEEEEEMFGDGDMIFSFDTHKLFSLFADYPQALTKEEKEIFDKENPFWADFFKDRR